jgi:pyruvate formate lyase activating enzyme
MSETTHVARYFHTHGDRVICDACPRGCALREGQHGFCFVRKNEGGVLVSLAYGKPNAVAVDPIEKKPLFHFLPGTRILSIGTAGCNLGCQFCQNWDLSKARSLHSRAMALAPGEVPFLAEAEGCFSVAFTYNEPMVFVEYAIDAARACRERGIAAVAVTAGYAQGAAREDLYATVQAANIDLKGFSDRFYQRLTLSHLAPVLSTIEHAVKQGVWVELTTLLIPGHNDSDAELEAECRWIVEHLGRDVPLHYTAFHPDYRLRTVEPTPAATLRRARQIARAEGLRFVYVGNVHDDEGERTDCPSCGEPLIERRWHAVRRNRLAATGGRCPKCSAAIPGVFDARSCESSEGSRYGLL